MVMIEDGNESSNGAPASIDTSKHADNGSKDRTTSYSKHVAGDKSLGPSDKKTILDSDMHSEFGSADGKRDNWPSIKEIFAFGDSWTDSGFDPGGKQPNESNPLGNPEFPTGPKGEPPGWVAYLTATYNSSFIRTYNLGAGAATIDRELLSPLFGMTRTFKEQARDHFRQQYSDHVRSASGNIPSIPAENRLFVVFFGLVDVVLMSRNHSADMDLLKKILQSYWETVEFLHAQSPASPIILLNLPPLDLKPQDPLSSESLEAVQKLLTKFNARIRAMRQELGVAWNTGSNTKVKMFDLDGFLRRVIDDPAFTSQTRKLRDTRGLCGAYNPDLNHSQSWDFLDPSCKIPGSEVPVQRDQYFWANSLHVTSTVQEAMAARLVEDCFGVGGGGGKGGVNFCT
ncbi:MAG: hypothetical protein M1831_004073 [Alyxoria varia]|nr:MAG: hypothetical protein M1831_004073 [Alyxoria varia]